MAEGNGFISPGDPRVDEARKRLQDKNDGRFKELEDAMLVMSHLENKQIRAIKALAEGAKEQRQQAAAQRALNAETDRRISALVSAIGESITKQNTPDAGRL